MLDREAAPAKVNLFLHVGPTGSDGYHPIASLMVFADFGDEVAVAEPGADFTVSGPFAGPLEREGDNLILRALDAWRAAGGGVGAIALHLEKRLPVAAGLGGGSADAAAALRLLSRRDEPQPSSASLAALALSLGADVPACLAGRACIAEGRGEQLSAPPAFPDLAAVLVNPGVGVSTAAVFRRFDARAAASGLLRPASPERFEHASELFAWLARQRNDLEAPAMEIAPVVAETLARLGDAQECRLARMSGSGATCFALVDDTAAAERLAMRLKSARPGWWVQPCRLRGSS